MARVAVKVIPGASTDEIVGWLGDALKVKVRARPEKGRANSAVSSLLAQALGMPGREVVVLTGHGSRNKVVEIAGLSDAEFRARLARCVPSEKEGGKT